MGRIFKYNRYIYIVVHIFIGLDIFNRTKDNINIFLIFMGLFLLVVLNNYLRVKYFYKDGNKFFLSMLIYMIISSILIFNINGYVDILNFMIIYELILFTGGNRSKIFIGLAIVNTFFIIILRNLTLAEILSLQFWQNNLSLQFWQENLIDLFWVIIYLLFYLVSLFGYKALRNEKWKVDRLNKELESSYNKLMDQSEEIEKLTIEKERNRVAGEIHDTLGHNLVALNMNLDVAEKLMDSDIDKTRELLKKAKTLSKESMASLRKAVYALKEEKPIALGKRLNLIIQDIESTGAIKIVLDMDEEVESLPLKHKDIIYKSIREGITNSIKHGKASKIILDIKFDEDKVNIYIKDNGLGCIDLVKGNGLLGIENRVDSIGGKVNYDSVEGKGFTVEILI